MSYVGDMRLGDTFDIKFCTVTSLLVPTQLAGNPVVSVYVGNDTTPITAGITLTVDFNNLTGLNNVRIVATSGNGYAAGKDYHIVITTGTVALTSVVGFVVGQFSIEKRSALMPTVATRTLDVSGAGEAGLDWANVGSPTSTVSLPGTTIGTTTAVTTVNGLAPDTITAAAVAPSGGAEIANTVWDTDATAHQTVGTFGQAIGDPGADTTTIYQSVVTDAAGTNIAVDIIAIEGQTDDIGLAGAGLTAVPWNAAWDAEVQSEVQDAIVDNTAIIADAVWDEAEKDHIVSGTTGRRLCDGMKIQRSV